MRGTGDTPPTGLSAGDSYVSHAKLRTPAGRLVGTYDVACTITDANDDGNAWSICTTTARIQHRSTLIASGLAELLQVKTSPGGFGVAPPTARFAIIGGTGVYTRRTRRRHLDSEAGDSRAVVSVHALITSDRICAEHRLGRAWRAGATTRSTSPTTRLGSGAQDGLLPVRFRQQGGQPVSVACHLRVPVEQLP